MITVNNVPIQSFNFSGGECHVSIADIEIGDVTGIKAHLYNSDSIMQLMMTVDAVRRKNPRTQIHLIIPYFPYARQDRVCNPGEAYSVVVMANMINSLKCESVTVYDPHSINTPILIEKCKIIKQVDIIKDSVVEDVINDESLILVSPDAGATNKINEIAAKLSVYAIYCTKVRDTKTGKITKTEIPLDCLVRGADFIIIDDICDGGRTFIELAKKLKEAGAEDLYLYVTHGIFSKGLHYLDEYFEHIYCYHTILPKDCLEHWDKLITVIGDK